MGFFIDPVKVTLQGTSHGAVIVSWDGAEPRSVAIGPLAKQLCLDEKVLFRELRLHSENDEVLPQLLEQARPFIVQHKQKLQASKPDAQHLFGDPNESDAPGPQAVVRQLQLKALEDFGAPFQEWKIDFSKISGVVIRQAMNKAVWDQCRTNQSKLATRNKDGVDRYQKALEAFVGKVKELRQALASAEAAAKAWRDGVGRSSLEAMSLLAVTHEMVSVYAQQDPRAQRLVARTQELVELTGEEAARDAFAQLKGSLDPLLKLYSDRDFCKQLFDYLEAWDPSHVYYFDAVVARSGDKKDLKDFDVRLFRDLARAGELLSQNNTHARQAADEVNKAALAVWAAAVDGSAALKPREERRTRSRALLDKLFETPSAGWLSVLITWSGMATVVVGNMEGPPSLASMALSVYARSQGFIEALQGRDGLLRWVLLVGVDAQERNAVLTLAKSSSEEARNLGRRIFTNGSWRSPSIFFAFYVTVTAILVFHSNELRKGFENGSKSGDFDSELLKLMLPVVQDLMSFALIGFTHYYSNQMGKYLRQNGLQRLDELAAQIERLESGTLASRASKVVHRGLSVVNLALALWTFQDERPTADVVEDWLLGMTAGAAAASLIGVVFTRALGALGPWGFVAGILLGFVTIAYQKWFKPKMGAAMTGVGKALLADAYLKSKSALVVGKRTSFVIFTSDIKLGELLSETVEQLTEFDWKNSLEPKHLLDYSRAGLPAAMIAQLYGLPEAEVKKQIRDGNAQDRRRQLGTVSPAVNLVRPATLQVKLIVGAFNLIQLEAVHPQRDLLPNNMWLEVDHPDPDALLADNGQFPPTTYTSQQVVLLTTRSSTRFGRIYEGGFRLNVLPPGGQVSFLAFVPQDKTATGPSGGLAVGLITQDLVFNVAP